MDQFSSIKIYTASFHVAISFIYDLLHHFDLLKNVARSSWFNIRIKRIEVSHDPMKSICVSLHHFHGLELFKPCLFTDLIFRSCIEITLKMSDVSDIPYISHFISQVQEIAVDHIKAYERPAVSDMNIIINGRTAHIHAHMPFYNRRK